jgi:molybdopterin-containing oxidoreductase family membrane subunit
VATDDVVGTAPARPELLLDHRPEDTDDLTLIRGISDRTAEALNRNGIYLFSQLAEMSPEDAKWVQQAVSAFPNRIERDDWSGQARQLMESKPDDD